MKGCDRSFDNDKQTQVESYLPKKYETTTPPSDEDREGLNRISQKSVKRQLHRVMKMAKEYE